MGAYRIPPGPAFSFHLSETTAAGARNFVWNYATGLPSVAIVQDAAGDRRYYIYLPDGSLLYAIDAATNARHFYHFDENGSTVLLTDDKGAITDSYGITPYGETVTQNGSTENPFTWLGQWGAMQEGSTSLYYMRARYYDSTTARFLTPDPALSADPQRVNPYEYALANPVGFADASGFDPWSRKWETESWEDSTTNIAFGGYLNNQFFLDGALKAQELDDMQNGVGPYARESYFPSVVTKLPKLDTVLTGAPGTASAPGPAAPTSPPTAFTTHGCWVNVGTGQTLDPRVPAHRAVRDFSGDINHLSFGGIDFVWIDPCPR